MSDSTPGPDSGSAPLPDSPSVDWLRKKAKRSLAELRRVNPAAKLAEAQFALAKSYGFPSWRALKAQVESRSADRQLFDAAADDDIDTLAALLGGEPEKLRARMPPYGWTLLHIASNSGQLRTVEMLLGLGLSANEREPGDNTTPMHWAAAAGHLDVVHALIGAGGDVIGDGDDHELQIIGWATAFGASTDAHRAIAALLLSRGARQHIFSAIALDDGDEVLRLVAHDPDALVRRMSRHENGQLPLHFAVRTNRRRMVELLLELGADPNATDLYGASAATYAASPDVDSEILSALGRSDSIDVLADGEGALHLLAKRGDLVAVRRLLEHGAKPDALWSHWDAEVTPLHLAAAYGHADVVRELLNAGADPTICDSKHGGDARGWAESGREPPAPNWREIVQIINEHTRAR